MIVSIIAGLPRTQRLTLHVSKADEQPICSCDHEDSSGRRRKRTHWTMSATAGLGSGIREEVAT